MTCTTPLKGWKKHTGGIAFKPTGLEQMEVACGQCMGCRIDKAQTWAMRITHEAQMHKDNVFITLTYRPEYECSEQEKEKGYHVPNDWSLSVPKKDEFGNQIESSHFQAFMKRLRKAFPDRKLRYFMCGEYGNVCRHGFNLEKQECPLCNTGRPHYHACIFNLRFDDLYHYSTTENGQYRYTSPKLAKIWKYGFVDVGELNPATAQYCARYCLKKVTGERAADHYQNVDEYGEIHPVEPEFAKMSQGLGKTWAEKFASDMFPTDEVPIPGKGVRKKIPRYYMDKEEERNPQSVEEVKAKRQKYRKDHEDEYDSDRLASKDRIQKAQIRDLKRTL